MADAVVQQPLPSSTSKDPLLPRAQGGAAGTGPYNTMSVEATSNDNGKANSNGLLVNNGIVTNEHSNNSTSGMDDANTINPEGRTDSNDLLQTNDSNSHVNYSPPGNIITQVQQDGTPMPQPGVTITSTENIITSPLTDDYAGGSGQHHMHDRAVSSRFRSFVNSLLCCLGTQKPHSSLHDFARQSTVEAEPTLPEGHLLSPQTPRVAGKKCLVLDLDETLVHSSFKPVGNPNFIIPVNIDDNVYNVYVTKRPHVDEFLARVSKLYEVVMFTASLSKYADPVCDMLDQEGVFSHRLFRESCVFYKGTYVKDLNRLGRNLQHTIIIDNSPMSYILNPDNAIPITSWFTDMDDRELLDLIPLLEELEKAEDVMPILAMSCEG
eukprot:Clim_evm25s34 gene=Clim_evmTU25s34